MDTDTPVRSDAVCLYIPVKHSRDKVTVPLEALPKDPDVLLDIFKAEEVRACVRACGLGSRARELGDRSQR